MAANELNELKAAVWCKQWKKGKKEECASKKKKEKKKKKPKAEDGLPASPKVSTCIQHPPIEPVNPEGSTSALNGGRSAPAVLDVVSNDR